MCVCVHVTISNILCNKPKFFPLWCKLFLLSTFRTAHSKLDFYFCKTISGVSRGARERLQIERENKKKCFSNCAALFLVLLHRSNGVVTLACMATAVTCMATAWMKTKKATAAKKYEWKFVRAVWRETVFFFCFFSTTSIFLCDVTESGLGAFGWFDRATHALATRKLFRLPTWCYVIITVASCRL